MPKLAGCMIGREAVRKPWIFLEIKEMEGERKIDLLEVATIFINNLLEYQPEEFQLLRAKRFFCLFCDNFQFSHYIRTKLLNAKILDDFLPILTSYFEEVSDDRWK